MRTNTYYTVATFGWTGLVFAATFAVYSGMAAPYATRSTMPSGPLGMVAVAAGLVVAGALAIRWHERRTWQRAGRAADLAPEGGGLRSWPVLAGSAGGRTVRARTAERVTGGGGETGSSTKTVTVVEADLDGPAEQGLVVGRGDGSGPIDLQGLPAEFETTAVGDYAVIGGSEDLARAVLDGRVQNALAEPEMVDSVLVGKAADVLLEAVPDGDGGLLGGLAEGIEHRLREQIPGDGDVAYVETDGAVLDGDELRRQAEAVAAVAESFEEATAGQRRAARSSSDAASAG